MTRWMCLIALLVGCPKTQAPPLQPWQTMDLSGGANPEMPAAPTASETLDALFQDVWDERMASNPVSAAYEGLKTNYDQWTPYGIEFDKAQLEKEKAALATMQALDATQLSDQERLSIRLFAHQVGLWEEGLKWHHHSYPVNQMHGSHRWFASFLINIHSIDNPQQAKDYIARLDGLKDQLAALNKDLLAREKMGVLPPAFVFPHVIRDCENLISGAPFEADAEPGTLLKDFTEKLAKLELPDAEAEALRSEAERALNESVKPGYETLITTLTNQQKRANTDDGAWKLPDGGDYYAFRLKRMTTTDLSPEAIHQLGLDEVARIHGEMNAIREQVGFEGTLQEFFVHLRTDPKFFYENTPEGKERYLKEATAIIDTMEGRLDELFITKPKAALEVKAVEAYREKSAGKAFYQSPAPDGSRPGTYYANLYDMGQMPPYQMEALAYHEGIPGHHMQLSIAQEIQGLPEVRKRGGYTAYSEGWGLYSEFIPKEMGFYEDPYSDFGRLAMELWRACRLVVDTGMHHKKWTREEAIAYLETNTPNPQGDIVKAIERYIVMPGQATAYKIGMLKILELRGKAKDELGDAFDIREFHEVVLTNGPVPLDVLEELVDAWVASKKAAAQ